MSPIVVLIPLLFVAAAAVSGERAVTVCEDAEACNFAGDLAVPKQEMRLEVKGFGGAESKGIDIEEAPRTGALILFDHDRDRLKPHSLPILDKLARDLTQGALHDAVLQIAGHADTTGSDHYNLDLSERRALSVVRYLRRQGVPNSRLELRGYGESSSICPNDTETQRAWNRRVEFLRVGSVNANDRRIATYEAHPGDKLQGDCNVRPGRS